MICSSCSHGSPIAATSASRAAISALDACRNTRHQQVLAGAEIVLQGAHRHTAFGRHVGEPMASAPRSAITRHAASRTATLRPRPGGRARGPRTARPGREGLLLQFQARGGHHEVLPSPCTGAVIPSLKYRGMNLAVTTMRITPMISAARQSGRYRRSRGSWSGCSRPAYLGEKARLGYQFVEQVGDILLSLRREGLLVSCTSAEGDDNCLPLLCGSRSAHQWAGAEQGRPQHHSGSAAQKIAPAAAQMFRDISAEG